MGPGGACAHKTPELSTQTPAKRIVLLCCFISLAGWLGLNAAGALLFAGAQPGAFALAGVNTVISGELAGSSRCRLSYFAPLDRIRHPVPKAAQVSTPK